MDLLFFFVLSSLLRNSVRVGKGCNSIGKKDNSCLPWLRSDLFEKEEVHSDGMSREKQGGDVDQMLLSSSLLSSSLPQSLLLNYHNGKSYRRIYPYRQRLSRILSGGGGEGGGRARKEPLTRYSDEKKKDNDVPTPIVTSSEPEDDIPSSIKQPMMRDGQLVEQIKYENERIEEGLRDGWQGTEGSGSIRIINGAVFKRLANGDFILRHDANTSSSVEPPKRTTKNVYIKREDGTISASLASDLGSSPQVSDGNLLDRANASTMNNSRAFATLGVPPLPLPPPPSSHPSHSNTSNKATTSTDSRSAKNPSINPMGRRVTIREWRSGGETYEEVADPKHEIEMALNGGCGDESVAAETRRKIQDIRAQYGLPESEEASTPHSYTPEPEKELPDDETWRKMCEVVERCDEVERADKEAKMRKALGLMQSDGFAKGFLKENTLQKREILRKIAATAGDSTVSSVDIDDDVTSYKMLRDQEKQKKKSRGSANLVLNPAVLEMLSSLKEKSNPKHSAHVAANVVPNAAKGFTSSCSDSDDTGV